MRRHSEPGPFLARGLCSPAFLEGKTGNPDFDLAALPPSPRLEGGPAPEELLPGAGRLAAALAGLFLSRAGLPPPPTAPLVRQVQLARGEVALAWAFRDSP
ncbi:MAG TPA: hypothetical protein VGU26_08375 [Gaiellaceae bacterium]|nr:hypothetical protein [Gaiellaceae bacterium]